MRPCASALAACLAVAAAACGDHGPPGDGGGIVLADENGYTFTGGVDIGVVEVTAQTDATVAWGTLTADLQGHTLDPAADVDEVLLVKFRDEYSTDDVEAILSRGDLQTDDTDAVFLWENENAETTAALTAFSIFGSLFEPDALFLEGPAYWAVSLVTNGVPGSRAVTFVDPLTDAANTHIEITSESARLDFTADLTSLTPPDVAAGGPYTVDWSGLTTNGRGGPIDLDLVDELLLGRYEGTTAEDLQAHILDLEQLADQRYALDVYGDRSADLADARDAAGAAFAGFDADVLYALALRCTRCASPAPPFLTVFEVR